MIVFFSGLFGFLSSFLPDVVGMFKAAQDNKHELKMLALQRDIAKDTHTYKLEEISAHADIAEAKVLHLRGQTTTKIKWIDGLNALVRPVIALSFFGLYAWIKLTILRAAELSLPWQRSDVWTENDMAILVGIVSFYFGSRAIEKFRNRK